MENGDLNFIIEEFSKIKRVCFNCKEDLNLVDFLITNLPLKEGLDNSLQIQYKEDLLRTRNFPKEFFILVEFWNNKILEFHCCCCYNLELLGKKELRMNNRHSFSNLFASLIFEKKLENNHIGFNKYGEITFEFD